MSAIKKELMEATGVAQKRGQDEQEYLKALVKGVSDLDDKGWNGLSVLAQDWFNEAADAVNAKKEVASFPDAEKEEVKEEEATPRRRAASKEESDDKPAQKDPKVGDDVVITTKRGKTVEGKVTEIDDDQIVVAVGDNELEIVRKNIETIVVAFFNEEKKTTRRRAAEEEPEEPAFDEPKVGDQVTAVTAKDKTYSGEIIEIEDDLIVVKVGDEELELTPSKLKKLTIHPAETKTSRRKAADDEGDAKPRGRAEAKEEPAAKGSKIGVKSNGGVSVTQRMRELICADLGADKDAIMKIINKEGLKYREATMDVVFADTHKVVTLLKANKLMK